MNVRPRPLHVVVVYIALVVVPVTLAVGILYSKAGVGSCRAPCTGRTVTGGNDFARLLLAIAVIVLACKAFGALARRIGQPSVIGEIATGILLGPSVLGVLSPAGARWLLPPPVLDKLNVLAQLGVVLFVFLAGMELDIRRLRGLGQLATVVSHVSIAFPFLLGILVAVGLYGQFAPRAVDFLPFALFVGVSMSITALPVMARILMDTGLYRSEVGTVALTCALIDDVTAWCLLALVVTLIAGSSPVGIVATLSLTALFAVFMVFVVRPLLARASHLPAAGRPELVVPLALVAVLVSALASELIGVHPIFGAFLLGLVVPRDLRVASRITGTIGGLTAALLLPLFFADNGLHTEIGLLGLHAGLWLWCAVILLVAIAGKFGGSAVAARAVGASWSQSLQIGTLMNCRGLTELIVLNVGLDLGVLSPTLFTMLVLMTLVSTAMAAPIVTRFRSATGWDDQSTHFRRWQQAEDDEDMKAEHAYLRMRSE